MYLEIYNYSSETIDLNEYAWATVFNAPDIPGNYEYWNTFDSGAVVMSGDVYVLCHSSADSIIQSECDQTSSYFS